MKKISNVITMVKQCFAAVPAVKGQFKNHLCVRECRHAGTGGATLLCMRPSNVGDLNL